MAVTGGGSKTVKANDMCLCGHVLDNHGWMKYGREYKNWCDDCEECKEFTYAQTYA